MTRMGCVNPFPINEELLRPLVQGGLKFICSSGAGFDHVDIEYLTKNKVYYANNPISVGIRTA